MDCEMKMPMGVLGIALISGCATIINRMPQSASDSSANSPWILDSAFEYDTNAPGVGSVKLRTGYLPESHRSSVTFQGCILYLEGLGDSMRNHEPYFRRLNGAGYRIIAFDYMGQGGSEGSMNNTRIIDPLFPGLQISSIAKKVWEHYENFSDSSGGINCSGSKKIVLGWSTGGLAAYELAHEGWAEAVILIAPGIAPKVFVGEAANDPELFLQMKPVITLRTLTRVPFQGASDPHRDSISPGTPEKVPLFASNLLISAGLSHLWQIPESAKGLVFVSGIEDTYIDRNSLIKIIREKAPNFQIKEFSGALHELDNELPEVAEEVRESTVSFLNTIR
jgi:alpha-beta hydrolase superfamily lysophospholipase